MALANFTQLGKNGWKKAHVGPKAGRQNGMVALMHEYWHEFRYGQGVEIPQTMRRKTMKHSISKSVSLPLLALLAVLAVGCKEQGPAERAGEQIDEATEELRDGAKDVGNKIEDACEELKEDMGAEDKDC